MISFQVLSGCFLLCLLSFIASPPGFSIKRPLVPRFLRLATNLLLNHSFTFGTTYSPLIYSVLRSPAVQYLRQRRRIQALCTINFDWFSLYPEVYSACGSFMTNASFYELLKKRKEFLSALIWKNRPAGRLPLTVLIYFLLCSFSLSVGENVCLGRLHYFSSFFIFWLKVNLQD